MISAELAQHWLRSSASYKVSLPFSSHSVAGSGSPRPTAIWTASNKLRPSRPAVRIHQREDVLASQPSRESATTPRSVYPDCHPFAQLTRPRGPDLHGHPSGSHGTLLSLMGPGFLRLRLRHHRPGRIRCQ